MKRLLLLVGLLFWSCEDDRAEEPLVESIQMWVNGTEIIAREYYESIITGCFGMDLAPSNSLVEAKTSC